MEVTDDKGVIHLLINLKCILILVDPITPFQNVPHSTIFVWFEINIRDYQYKIEADIDHYIFQDNEYSCLSIYFVQIFGGSNTTPIFFKYLSTDFRRRKYIFVKGRYGDLATTIDDVLFNLDQWFWILIHRKKTLLNLWKYHQSDTKDWVH